MKPNKGSGRLARNIILVVLLAVLCIGGVELAACRHFAPDTYERIVAPVRYAAAVTVDAGKAALDAAGRFCVGRQQSRGGPELDRAADAGAGELGRGCLGGSDGGPHAVYTGGDAGAG